MIDRELRRLGLLFIAGFAVVAISTAFWGIFERDNLFARDDNPRRVLAELNVQRGMIFDRNNFVLAYTEAAEVEAAGAERVYPHPEVVTAIGHHSYRFGLAGLEEGYDDLLRADGLRDVQTELSDALFNRYTVGGDLQSTLDLEVQRALFLAMDGHSGAAIIAHVPSGEVLAMVSLPTYDPNREDILQMLVDEDAPESEQVLELPPDSQLLNRVTSGQYQPGGSLQTLLFSALLAAGVPSDEPVTPADLILSEPGLSMACALPGDSSETITLAEAYRRGCPGPFVEAVGASLSVAAIEEKMSAAGLWTSARLGGFLLPEDTPAVLALPSDENGLNAAVAGQGSLTVNPLQMVQVIAAVVNGGNGIPLHLDAATRYPPDADWQDVPPPTSRRALMQAANAETIRAALMEHNFGDDPPIYGHVSTALAGEREHVWFLGWTPTDDGAVVIAIVLEFDPGNGASPQAALDAVVPALEAVVQ
jgi:cell division protein FtsI/penicillin-binding protein 2